VAQTNRASISFGIGGLVLGLSSIPLFFPLDGQILGPALVRRHIDDAGMQIAVAVAIVAVAALGPALRRAPPWASLALALLPWLTGSFVSLRHADLVAEPGHAASLALEARWLGAALSVGLLVAVALLHTFAAMLDVGRARFAQRSAAIFLSLPAATLLCGGTRIVLPSGVPPAIVALLLVGALALLGTASIRPPIAPLAIGVAAWLSALTATCAAGSRALGAVAAVSWSESDELLRLAGERDTFAIGAGAVAVVLTLLVVALSRRAGTTPTSRALVAPVVAVLAVALSCHLLSAMVVRAASLAGAGEAALIFP
jgi:hypothetical protein